MPGRATLSALALYVIGAGTIPPAASGYRACHLPDGSLRIDPNWRLLTTTSTTDDVWLAGCLHGSSFFRVVSLAASAASAATSRSAAGGVAHPKRGCVLPGQRTPMYGVGCRPTSADASTLSGTKPIPNTSGRSEPRRKRRRKCRSEVCENLLYKDQARPHVRSDLHLRAICSRTPIRDTFWRRRAACGVRTLPSKRRVKSDSCSTTRRDDTRGATAFSFSPKCRRPQQSCQIRARCNGKQW